MSLLFFVVFLLPASDLVSFTIAFCFLCFALRVCFVKLKKDLVSDSYLIVDEVKGTISEENGQLLGSVSPFSLVTPWFLYLHFKGLSWRSNKLVYLSKLNKKDRKRLLRAVYRHSV